MENYTNPGDDARSERFSPEPENTRPPYESQPYRYSYGSPVMPEPNRYTPTPKPPKKKNRML